MPMKKRFPIPISQQSRSILPFGEAVRLQRDPRAFLNFLLHAKADSTTLPASPRQAPQAIAATLALYGVGAPRRSQTVSS